MQAATCALHLPPSAPFSAPGTDNTRGWHPEGRECDFAGKSGRLRNDDKTHRHDGGVFSDQAVVRRTARP